MRYKPYHKLAGIPNIVVDGRGNESTRLTLSHWPGNDTPSEFKADLSAQILFNYLDSRDATAASEVEFVTNNHFDEDGLVSLYALLNPSDAQSRKQFLINVAGAGDFGVCQDRDAARVSFLLSAWTLPELSPLHEDIFKLTYPEQTAVLYEELLVRLPNIIDHIDRLERYWLPEDTLFATSENQIASGRITIEEHEEEDLAVVRLGNDADTTCPWSQLVHQMSVHNRTERTRILLTSDKRHELYYRYETWVDFQSRKLRPRVDLSPLAQQLSLMENGKARWQYDGNDHITPRLHLHESMESSIASRSYIETILQYLREQREDK